MDRDYVFYDKIKSQIFNFGLELYVDDGGERPDIRTLVVHGATLDNGKELIYVNQKFSGFYFDESEALKNHQLKNAKLERIAKEVFQRLNPKQGMQEELFSFYSAFSTEELCSLFLLKYEQLKESGDEDYEVEENYPNQEPVSFQH